MKPLCILLLTFERTAYALQTLRSALDNLHYSGPLHVHIADDGSKEEHRQALWELAAGYGGLAGIGMSCTGGGSYGHNYNLAMQDVHLFAEYVLPLEDDWELLNPLDIDPLVGALDTGELGCIRLGYIGYTQELRGRFATHAGVRFLELDPDSPEPHVWAGHPRLETREWQRAVGPWPEGLDPGTTEFTVAQRRAAREGVGWPVDLVSPRGDMFAHIGAVQARTDQREEALA